MLCFDCTCAAHPELEHGVGLKHVHVQAKATVPSLITKTSIMLGMGETDEQIFQTLHGALCTQISARAFQSRSRQPTPLLPPRSYAAPHSAYPVWPFTAIQDNDLLVLTAIQDSNLSLNIKNHDDVF